MTVENAKKMFAAEISEFLADEFLRHCEQKRYLKFGAIEGALKTFMVLDSDLQVQLMASDLSIEDAKQIIHESIIDSQISKFLDALSDAEKQKVLADAKAYKGKVSQKT